MRRILLFLFATLGILPAQALDFWDDREPVALARDLVAAMTPAELASQVLMLAFASPVPDPGILTWVRSRSLGGVKFFGWNSGTPVQVAEATAALQTQSQQTRFRIPLLVATDQEGGWVRHIKGSTSTTPGNLSLGASGLPSDAWKTANLLGFELRQMGVNMNFAPSVDLYINPEADVIGPRSFSQDPVRAGVLGMAFFRGLLAQGVIATAKHFPGHGNTGDDSHGRLPVLLDDLKTLEDRELVPYKMLIAEGLEAIMSGHLAFPQITGDHLPASLSPVMIQGLLRRELGFTGVVITDDLYMEGARPSGWSIATAAEKALEAGNDLLLISKPASAQDEAWRALVRGASPGPAFDRLREAARRVIELKLRRLKGPGAVPLIPRTTALAVPAPDAEPFITAATGRGASVVVSHTWPWKPSSGELLVITPYVGAWKSLSVRYPGASLLEYPWDFYASDPEVLKSMAARIKAAPRAIFVLATPGGVEYLKKLSPYQDKLGVISVLSPVYLRDVPWVKDAVAVFGTNNAAFEVAAATVAGEIVPQGRLSFRFGDFPPVREGSP